jgi:hypothetical protein
MKQTPRCDAPCLEASQALHAAVIAPAGAVAVQQQALAAQAAAVAGIGGRAWRDAGTTPMPPGDDHHTPVGIGQQACGTRGNRKPGQNPTGHRHFW